MMKSKYPHTSKYIGSLGADEQGSILKQILQEEGVVDLMYQTKDYPTGLCAAIIHNKERSLIANLGAAVHFPTAHFAQVATHTSQAHVIYATAFFLTSNAPALLPLLRLASQNHQIIAFNLSATFLID